MDGAGDGGHDNARVALRDYVEARLKALEDRLRSERLSDLHAAEQIRAVIAQLEREHRDVIPRAEFLRTLEAAAEERAAIYARLRHLETMYAWLWGALAALGAGWAVIDRLFPGAK